MWSKYNIRDNASKQFEINGAEEQLYNKHS